MKYLKLIRYQNILIIALMMAVFHFGFLKQQEGLFLALSDVEFILLIIATVCIAAGGYIINNIVDQRTDEISKPESVIVGKFISENTAYTLYFIFNVVGVGIAFYVSNIIFHSNFAGIFIVTAFLLYIYATQFKQSLLAGNFIVSFLVALSILIVGIFDLYPVISPENRPYLGMLFKIFIDYAIFAFLINFLREVVKDIEDFEGDSQTGMNTLPIFLGIDKTKKILFALTFIPLMALVFYIKNHLTNLEYALYYFMLFIIAPLLFFMLKIWQANTPKDFKLLSFVLKIILIAGILSVLVIDFNVKYNIKLNG